MKRVVEMMKALGEENRFRIVMMLRERPLCVCEICTVLDISVSTVSTHLKQLTQAGILESEKDGRWVIYSLTENETIRKLTEKIAAMVMEAKQLELDKKAVKETSPEKCSIRINRGNDS